MAGAFLATILSKLPLLFPAAKGWLGPIGSHEFFCPLVLYSAPFLFLAYILSTPGELVQFRLIDLLYGSITTMNVISFFRENPGFLPVNPMLTELSCFFLYLLIRNLHSRCLRGYTLFLLAIPLIPSAGEALHGLIQASQAGLPARGSFYNYNSLGMLLAMSIPIAVSQFLSKGKGPVYRTGAILLAAFFVVSVILTPSRTAACGTVLALGTGLTVYYFPLWSRVWKTWKIPMKLGAVSLGLFLAGMGSYLVYTIRPLSFWGRFSLCRLGSFTF